MNVVSLKFDAIVAVFREEIQSLALIKYEKFKRFNRDIHLTATCFINLVLFDKQQVENFDWGIFIGTFFYAYNYCRNATSTSKYDNM